MSAPGVGHNSSPGGTAGAEIKSYIERLERLAEDRKTISDDMRDVMTEAKGRGFNPKAIRLVLKRRAMEKAEREALDNDVDTYEHALGALFE